MKEKQTATLKCELTKENATVKWLKNGKEIAPNDHFEIITDGFQQKLIIHDTTLDDKAEYTCVCGDVSTKATLTIEGNMIILEVVKR